VIQQFYDVLLSVMKEAKHLSFDQRYQRLAPTIAAAYNLPLMSRLSIGPSWPQLPPAQQQQLGDLITRYTVSVYASEFNNFNGERFVVEPETESNANGTVVKTAMVKSNGERVTLNYLMRADKRRRRAHQAARNSHRRTRQGVISSRLLPLCPFSLPAHGVRGKSGIRRNERRGAARHVTC
jgi:phospholipid transport system substrate-binding protein